MPSFLHSVLSNPNQADEQILRELQEINQKHIQRADEEYLDLGTISIFNVGPNAHTVPMGGLGTFLIPACEEGQPYSKPLKIGKMFPEGRNVDMQEIIEVLQNGYQLVESIVGYGKFCNASSNLTNRGVFTCGAFTTVEYNKKRETMLTSEVKEFTKKVGGAKYVKIIQTRKVTQQAISWAIDAGHEGSKEEITADILAANYPTEQEVLDAQNHLNKWCLDLVSEANTYFRAGNHIEIQDLHRWAAMRTNNTSLQWVKGSLLMGKCPACATAVDTEAAICGACRTVINKQKVIDLQVPGYESLWQKKSKPETQPSA